MGPLSAALSHSFSHSVEGRPFPPSPSQPRGEKNSGITSSTLREPEEPPRGQALVSVLRVSFQARTVGSHSLFLPHLRLEPQPFPRSAYSGGPPLKTDQRPSILLIIPTSHRNPEFLRALSFPTQEKKKGGENQFVASGKNMASSHLGAVGRDLDSSVGWGLGLVAGYKGLWLLSANLRAGLTQLLDGQGPGQAPGRGRKWEMSTPRA